MSDDEKKTDQQDFTAHIEADNINILEGTDGTFAVELPLEIVMAFGKPPNFDPEKHETGYVMIPGLPSEEHANGFISGVLTAIAMVRIAQYADVPDPRDTRH